MQRRHHGSSSRGRFPDPLTLQGSVVTIGVSTTPTSTGSVPLANQTRTIEALKKNTTKVVLLLQEAQGEVVMMPHLATSDEVYKKLVEATKLLQANYRKQEAIFKAAATGGA